MKLEFEGLMLNIVSIIPLFVDINNTTWCLH